MGKAILLPFLVSLSLAMVFMAEAQVGPPVLPLIINGNITINGEKAPAETLVEARINDAEITEYLVKDDGNYVLTVSGSLDDFNKTVEVFVNRIKAAEVPWRSGEIVKKDLAIEVGPEVDMTTILSLSAIAAALALIVGAMWFRKKANRSVRVIR